MNSVSDAMAFDAAVAYPARAVDDAVSDTGAIVWLLPEIVAAFDAATAALRSFRAGAAGVDRKDVDLAPLRVARSHVHQAHGALEVGELVGVTKLTEAIEDLLASFEAEPDRCDATTLDAIIGGCRAIVEYLEDVQSGERQQPLRLYPSYRDLMAARRVGRVHPADLFVGDLQVRVPRGDAGSLLTAEALGEHRSLFEQGLLRYLRNDRDANALSTLARAVTAIEGSVASHAADGQHRAYWWATRALFEALQHDGFAHVPAQQEHLKRLAGRVNMQIRKLVDGSNVVAERLFNDTLFFVALARPVTPHVGEVKSRFRLDQAIPERYDVQRYGRIDPVALRAARDALASAKTAWSAIAAGDVGQISAFTRYWGAVVEAVGPIRRRGLTQVAQVVDGVATDLGFDPRQPAANVGLDVAIALLFLEASLARARLLDDAFDERAALVVARVEAALIGHDAPAAVDWLDRMTREAEERLTVVAFVVELQSNLRNAEKILDAFFRDPTDRGGLKEARHSLAQASGALSLLGHDDVHAAIDQALVTIERFEHESEGDSAAFESLAQSLGAVGFYVEQIKRERIDHGVFGFDPVTGRFTADLARAPVVPVEQGSADTAMPTGETSFATDAAATDLDLFFPATEVRDTGATIEDEIVARAADALDRIARLREHPDDPAARAQLVGAVDDVRRHAMLLDDRELQDEASAVLRVLRDRRHEALGFASAAELADQVTELAIHANRAAGARAPASAPLAPTVPVPSADNVGAMDAELLEIFLEEAEGVLVDAAASLRVLDADPDSTTAAANLRRGFHTLKGSGRMVGLMAFGEAAWSIEETLNGQMAAQRPASTDLRALVDYAIRYLADWVGELRDSGTSSRIPDAMIEAAKAVRVTEDAGLARDDAAAVAADAVRSVAGDDVHFAATQVDDGVHFAATQIDDDVHFAATQVIDDDVHFAATQVIDDDVHFAATQVIDGDVSFAATQVVDDTDFAALYGIDASPDTSAVGIDPASDGRLRSETPVDRDRAALAAAVRSDVAALEPDDAALALPVDDTSAPPTETAFEPDPAVDLTLGFESDTLVSAGLDAVDPVAPAGAVDAVPADERAATTVPVVEAPVAQAPVVDEPVARQPDQTIGAGETDPAGVEALPVAASVTALPFRPTVAVRGDEVRHIGSVTLSVALFNIYLTEADELLRVLTQDFAEWRHELDRHATEGALRAVHSLAGSSATVGCIAAHDLAAGVELVLQALWREPVALRDDQVVRLQDAVESLRKMLHRFAAERLPEPDPVRLAGLLALERELAGGERASADAVAATAPPASAPVTDEVLPFEPLDFGGMPSFVPVEPAGTGGFAGDAVEDDAFELEALAFPPGEPASDARTTADEMVDAGATLFGESVFGRFDVTAIVSETIEGEAIDAEAIDADVTDLGVPVDQAIGPEAVDHAVGYGTLDFDVIGPASTFEVIEHEAGDVDFDRAGTDVTPAVTDEAGAVAPAVVSSNDDAPALPASDDRPAESVDAVESMAGPAPVPEADAERASVPPSMQDDAQRITAEAGGRTAPVSVPPTTLPDALQLRDEIDADLLDVFVAEGGEILPQIGTLLRTWQSRRDDAAPARMLLRHLHTLKGSARMAGAMRLGEVVHDLEARVESAARLQHLPTSLVDELLASHDRSLELFDRLQNPEAIAADSVQPVDALPASTAADEPAAKARATPDDSATAQRADTRAADTAAATKPAVRVDSETLDRLVNLAGEVSISRARIENEVQQIKASMSELNDNVDRLRSQLREIEMQAEFQMQSKMQSQQGAGAERDKFDPLEFDRFTRFQELTRMMAESVNDVKTLQSNLQKNVDSAEGDLASQRRMTRDLQQDLMRVRMVPFSSIAERLYRVARRTAKEVDKRVNLDIRGGSVEIDRSVLERMAGPFEHLLRNHIVHGIEGRDARRAAGKDETGELLVEVRQEGNEIVLTFSDDGAGLDRQRIRDKGRALGLIGDAASDAEVAELIFHPGFSTASEITELAGRGVGMDVVRAEVLVLAGRASVDSTSGRGTRFTINLPLTLAITQVLLVGIAGRVYALPAVLVEQVQQLQTQPLADAYRAGHLEWDGAKVRLLFLGGLLGIDDTVPVAQRTSPVLILRSAGERLAIHVDEVIGNQEVVVKNLGPQLARMTGIAGATVLGSGQIVLILNPVQLAQARPDAIAAPSLVIPSDEDTQVAGGDLKTLPTVMVVDDSLTVRRVTQRLLSREGYQVVLAKDGVDALEQLQGFAPDAMLVDIEMPRMDGFDLTRTLRSDERYRHIPIIMITSRTAEKHRLHAAALGVDAYLGKPYGEDELLDLLTLHTAVARSQPA